MVDEPDGHSAGVLPLPEEDPGVTNARDPESFNDFYRLNFRSLINFLIHDGAQAADALDIAQETMLDAWKAWSGIRHPKTWVRIVAERKLIRRKTSVPENPVAELPESAPALRDGVDISAWEERHDELKALAALPFRQRQVMAWHLDGYKDAEIADHLQISTDAVRANLMKARRNLAHYRNSIEEGQ
ncbi:RNA polymerase sigma factor [Nocardia sp. NPDC004722]